MLIQRDNQGNWCLKGVKWSELHEGAVITIPTYEKLYAALWELKDYEAAGSVAKFKKLIKVHCNKQTPFMHKEADGTTYPVCSMCTEPLTDNNGWRADYCPHCGQAVLWKEQE